MENKDLIQLVKDFEKIPIFTIDGGAYVISKEWLRGWKSYIGYGGISVLDEPPDSNLNGKLCKNGLLDAKYADGIDYVIVNDIVWREFNQRYNLSPEIKLEVVQHPIKGNCVPVKKNTNIDVVFQDRVVPQCVHEYMKVEELKSIICKLFNIVDDADYVLYDIFDPNRPILMENKELLSKYSPRNGQSIRLSKLITSQPLIETSSFSKQVLSTPPIQIQMPIPKVTNVYSFNELKPQNIQPININSGIKGKVGLLNIGNTCYLNSVLQAVLHTRPLVEYLTQPKPKYLNTGVINELINIAKEIWVSPSGSSIRPTKLMSEVRAIASQYMGYLQHDAHEFFTFLVDLLDQNDIDMKDNEIPVFVGNGNNDHQVCNQMIDFYQKNQNSIVFRTMQGILKLTYTCPSCAKKYITFQPYYCISLPLSTSISQSIFEYIQRFSNPTQLDEDNKWNCKHCNDSVCAHQQSNIYSVPKILVFQLNRFIKVQNQYQKDERAIIIPETIDMSRFVINQNNSGVYHLYAIIQHSGTINSGHYFSHIKIDNSWYMFNDSSVTKSSLTSIDPTTPYMLFYEQV